VHDLDTSEKESRYELLHRIGVALSGEQDRDRLLDLILTEAQKLCRADGGTLYLCTDDDKLEFAIMKNSSLGIELGGVSGSPIKFPALHLYDKETGEPNHHNVATYATHVKKPVHIADAYDSESFDFSGTKAFDHSSGYRSKSFLTIPLINSERTVIGVLQLLNALDDEGNVVPFAASHRQTVQALSSQAAIALDNKLLMEAQKTLLESFIKMMAAAIDAKSPYTGAHCERVPLICEMLMSEVCKAEEGPFSDFSMTEDELYELHIAAWLHDCGKVTTPTHVMDKGTKLETIHDRISEISARFEILKRDAQIEHLHALLAGEDKEFAKQRLESSLQNLSADLMFLKHANIGGEYLPEVSQDRVREIGRRVYEHGGNARRLLSDDEVLNLTISKGTLTDDERMVINGHMVQTVRMLDALPFPRNLKRVPEYAAGHHEKMDGTGYPRGTFASDMSLPARAMAIADVFEALTADDRPYKKAKKLSEAMRIMGFMKKDNHLDPELFDLFVSRGVYRRFAERYLDPSLCDQVDENALLAIEAKSFELPPVEERLPRKESLLKHYAERFPLREDEGSPFSIAPTALPGTKRSPSSIPLPPTQPRKDPSNSRES
jgi:HD-GYP domain-containing protein (c-di-GMP phosphodiesterase class II)